MKLILYYATKTINVCLLFLELKLNKKESTANEGSPLLIFIKERLFLKKKGEVADVKNND